MDVKEVATVVGVLISLAALLIAVFEYSLQGKLKRAEYFLKMRDRFFADDDFNAVQQALSTENEEEISKLTFSQKETYLGFLEEAAILEASGIINRKIAYYMFGYFAISCWRSEAFWQDFDRQDIFWSVFRRFAERMNAQARNSSLAPEKVRL